MFELLDLLLDVLDVQFGHTPLCLIGHVKFVGVFLGDGENGEARSFWDLFSTFCVIFLPFANSPHAKRPPSHLNTASARTRLYSGIHGSLRVELDEREALGHGGVVLFHDHVGLDNLAEAGERRDQHRVRTVVRDVLDESVVNAKVFLGCCLGGLRSSI